MHYNIAKTENIQSKDSITLVKTGNRYYLDLTDGTTGEYRLSGYYESMNTAYADYSKIAEWIVFGDYSFEGRAKQMRAR